MLAEPILARLRSTCRRGMGERRRFAAARAGHGRRHRARRRDIPTQPTPSPNCSQLPDIVRVLHRSERRLYLLLRSRSGRRSPAGSGQRRRGPPAADGIGRPSCDAARARRQRHRGAWPETGSRSADGALRPAAARRRDLRGARSAVHSRGDPRTATTRSRPPAAAPCPRCSTGGDIRGDLHMHTSSSDGRDSIEDDGGDVPRRSATNTWRSPTTRPHSAASRNLSAETIARQAEEIARLRERYPGDRDPARLRGRHPARWPPRLSGSGSRSVSTSCSHRCTSAPATRPTACCSATNRR